MTDWPGAATAQATELPEPPRHPFWTYHDLVLFLGAALPAAAVSLGLIVLLQRLLPAGSGRALPLLLGQFAGDGLWLLDLYGILHYRYDQPFWSSLHWSGSKRGVALSMFLGPAVAFGVAILGMLLNAPGTPTPMRALLSDRWSIFAMGIFATTLGPLCEELAFRGFLLPLLSRSFGTAAGVLLAAVPFALLHGPQYTWSWVHLALVGAAGACFGLARILTGSTAAATGMHATYNLTFFTAFLFQEGTSLAPW